MQEWVYQVGHGQQFEDAGIVLVCGFVEVAADDDIVMEGLEYVYGFDQVRDECLSWVLVGTVILVQCQPLLMPRCVADLVGWLRANLIDGINGEGWVSFSSQMYVTPATHWVSVLSFGF